LRLLFTLGMVVVFLEELLQMGFDEPPRGQGVHGGVGLHLGGVEEQLLASDKPGLDAHLDDPLEEVLEDLVTVAVPDLGEARVVGQRLAKVVADVPSTGVTIAGIGAWCIG
jgi:hypothetical protein